MIYHLIYDPNDSIHTYTVFGEKKGKLSYAFYDTDKNQNWVSSLKKLPLVIAEPTSRSGINYWKNYSICQTDNLDDLINLEQTHPEFFI